ncbi:hypothetical protein CIG19_13060 [Enterobacterales bacterium CwR94]|nr:hypothetical protein CIG19_13060 [Enterobacterales bacterium CwR94]
MKYVIAALTVGVTSLLTWWLIPGVMLYAVPSCHFDTTFVTEEPQRTVVSNGRWNTTLAMGIGTGSYNGLIRYFTAQGTAERPEERVSVSYAVRYKLVGQAIQSTTLESNVNMGNSAPLSESSHYVYPALSANFTSLNYLFRLNGGQLASGIDNNPRAICTPVE